MEEKKWYTSKIVWLGVLLTISGAIPLVVALLQQGSVGPADFVNLIGGILAVIMRVWFTDGTIER